MSAHRNLYLKEMGLAPLWRLRDNVNASAEESVQAVTAHESIHPEVHAAEARVAQRKGEAGDLIRPPSGGAAETAQMRRHAIAQMDWEQIEQTVRDCRACRLCEKRKQAVVGVGDRQADWLFVGEGPGAEEDERGEPFVGQAGKLLDAMLAAIELRRGNNVYIANTVKCRPPGNRTPEADEMASCFPFLERQIDLIRPKIIIALGRPAAQTLLNEEVRIGAARGREFSYRQIPLIVTYHPAYLLRNLSDKAKAWEDLCFAQDLVTRN